MVKLLLVVILFLGNSQPNTKELVVNCDLVEINHCYTLVNDQYIFAYTQYIFYDFCPSYRRENVIYWRLAENVEYTQINRFKHKCVTYDYDLKKKMIIYAKMIKESTTDTDKDSEKLNKKLHPEKFRPVFKNTEKQ